MVGIDVRSLGQYHAHHRNPLLLTCVQGGPMPVDDNDH